ncbi:HpcH/HpaI aldolase/citrate lyase family protein [Subtercola endophyticus]|uniref:HpcH/HpaI aldolase/citrate lyase family protein n=1 Tax=Subtercola endophyticus TaxID=2895559 RepID=UPI001E2A05C8|nr:CoA ester lyase [Subtercola endophyticus]UFS58754.1 CoA ester lyase [Subtercola endophyticus]
MSDTLVDVASAISFLFVPGDRPERFLKAAHSLADVVIIDWEDAVASESAPAARANTIAALTEAEHPPALVRISPDASERLSADLAAIEQLVSSPLHRLLGIVLAKAESAEHVARMRRLLPAELSVIPLIESARGLAAVASIASVAGVTRLAFGAVDFSLDVGASPDSETSVFARAQLVLASRVAQLPGPLESPSVEISDAVAVRALARRANDMGFGGMLAIHPRQLPLIRESFAPTPEQVRWAEAVVTAGSGASQVDGQLVDRPVVERARKLLARAAS